MSAKHTLLILFVVFLLGSAYPTGKLGLNDTIPPILFGSLRMAIVFICLIPFFKIQIIDKKYMKYAIKRIERSYENLSKFIHMLDKLSLKSGKSINFKVIREVLKKYKS